METTHLSQDLAHFVDFLIDEIGSGRVGFDDAVREYVEMYPGKIEEALKDYTVTMAKLGKDPEQESARMAARRTELRAFAAKLNTLEAVTLAEALITSQDHQISLLKTLEGLRSR